MMTENCISKNFLTQVQNDKDKKLKEKNTLVFILESRNVSQIETWDKDRN